MKNRFQPLLLALFASVLFLSGTVPSSARMQAPAPTQGSNGTSKKPQNSLPSAQEIADAKSKNLVWVNTSTRVYHQSSSSLYGTTKHGKFMTEYDAKKGGYRSARETGSSKRQPASMPAFK